MCGDDIVFVDMHIRKVQRDRLQWQVYLSGHEIEVIDVGRESEACVRASLIGRHNQCAVFYLELHKAKAWGLVANGYISLKPKYKGTEVGLS